MYLSYRFVDHATFDSMQAYQSRLKVSYVKQKVIKLLEPEQQGLWEFSLAIYAEDEVEQACLLMQDKLDIDVNLLLTCLWLAVTGRGRLNGDELADIEAQVAFWQQEIIQPLRQVRRRLKDLSRVGGKVHNSLRKSVSACELDAEQVEQQMLGQALIHRHQDITLGQARRLSDGLHNVLLLMKSSQRMENGWNRSLAILLGACFPGATRSQIIDILNAPAE